MIKTASFLYTYAWNSHKCLKVCSAVDKSVICFAFFEVAEPISPYPSLVEAVQPDRARTAGELFSSGIKCFLDTVEYSIPIRLHYAIFTLWVDRAIS